MQLIYDYLKPAIPSDHYRQSNAKDLVVARIRNGFMPRTILDLGCGTGTSVDFFRKHVPLSKWLGIDIEESPEVSQRTRNDAEFRTYDGVNIPAEAGQFDLIYSNQVLEHVRYPELILAEAYRVLSEDGLFIGQTSQLEPYHSYSYWNFTVFGFKRICEDAGFNVNELRPGIDGITLTKRSYLGRPAEYSRWFSEESPLNVEIEENAKKKRRRVQIINFRKLMYCGQFTFVLRR